MANGPEPTPAGWRTYLAINSSTGALLGAIVEVGGSLWFFKMTGPAKTVAAARPEFDKLVSSFKPGATP